ncbi:MAG: PAS domain S-box-containing protein [Urechidicola sp.]|jgi:PAS domain S-box-containing protein|tara:strand:- start:641 stop:1804 length:1164 start_codon:yes stop_codon:yes gene_type:complete
MLKSQEEELSNLLIEYAAGNYTVKGKLSEKQDEVDMIIQGINMLGEELMATNVSKDYFLSIYNAVTDLIIILDNNQNISDINSSVCSLFNIELNEVIGKSIYHIIGDKKSTFSKFERIKDSSINSYTFEAEIDYNNIKIIGLLTSSKIIDRVNNKQGFLIKIKDITQAKKTEQRIIQTIIRTEQNEQKRMADDLHDSLAQEVAMAKLMVTNLEVYGEKNDQNFNKLIQTSKHILDEAITHIREICYNLMPSVLIKGNIEIALSEFVKKLNSQNIIRFHYKSEGNFDNLNSEIEIVIFRIVQEFINNSIKHSKAKNVTIVTKINGDNNFFIELKDDGVGFNLKKLKPNTDGRGINNLKTKVNAFEGEYSLTSKENEGTRLKITFPKIN